MKCNIGNNNWGTQLWLATHYFVVFILVFQKPKSFSLFLQTLNMKSDTDTESTSFVILKLLALAEV